MKAAATPPRIDERQGSTAQNQIERWNKKMAKDTNTFEAYTAGAQKTFTEQTAQFSARMDDLAEFTTGNADAMITAARKATESMNEIASEMLNFSKATLDTNLAAFKELSQSKNATEFMEKQSTLTKAAVDTFALQAQKLNEMTVAAAKDCSEPVNARMAAVSELVKTGTFKA
jgi:phasin family protein